MLSNQTKRATKMTQMQTPTTDITQDEFCTTDMQQPDQKVQGIRTHMVLAQKTNKPQLTLLLFIREHNTESTAQSQMSCSNTDSTELASVFVQIASTHPDADPHKSKASSSGTHSMSCNKLPPSSQKESDVVNTTFVSLHPTLAFRKPTHSSKCVIPICMPSHTIKS